MTDPVDLMKPWSIKSVATRTQSIVAAAARGENLTVGQWLEKRVDEWVGAGSPATIGGRTEATMSHRTELSRGSVIADLAELLRAAGSLPEHMPLPAEVRRTINEYARMARGLPGQKPGHTARPRIDEAAPDALRRVGGGGFNGG